MANWQPCVNVSEGKNKDCKTPPNPKVITTENSDQTHAISLTRVE